MCENVLCLQAFGGNFGKKKGAEAPSKSRKITASPQDSHEDSRLCELIDSVAHLLL
jgi:hypothetical protein